MENAISYEEYRNLIDDLVTKKATTGENQSQEMIEYTALNQRRYKRLDKTLKVSEEDKKFFSEYPKKLIFLTITEPWCADAAQIIPMLNKIVEISSVIDLKFVLRDENDELMQHFLTNGGRAIPKLIILDSESKEVIHDWGPRPSEATKMVVAYKEKHGKLTLEFKEGLQHWYNENKGECISKDLRKILMEIK